MEIKEKILMIEDEKGICNFITTVLSSHEYEPLTAYTGEEAMRMISSHCPDLILLDLGLPDMDGSKIISYVRKWSQLPIIVVSARTHETEKVSALDLGADDYITKPFGADELLARIRTAIRHTRTSAYTSSMMPNGRFQAGALVIDYEKYRVYINGSDAGLTQNEFKLVALLGKNAGRVLTYDTIMRELWGPNAGEDNQILRVNMANIRRKIEKNPATPQYIFTEIGVGYRMVSGDELS